MGWITGFFVYRVQNSWLRFIVIKNRNIPINTCRFCWFTYGKSTKNLPYLIFTLMGEFTVVLDETFILLESTFSFCQFHWNTCTIFDILTSNENENSRKNLCVSILFTRFVACLPSQTKFPRFLSLQLCIN